MPYLKYKDKQLKELDKYKQIIKQIEVIN